MTVRRHPRADHDSARITQARATQARNEMAQQVRAARTVDDHATDPQDREMLIAMLGLDADRATNAQSGHVQPLN
ncbi:hypothetical protein [Kibdelosporangium phytohabitans]|uniref:Uncharacterized protein n=1 Tax=Kibdelosporangium phytohabitans TaxID=860235 RepID=A0A0N9HYA3_9PSEU|nr:hypothetical protein [Kibdelosporangium phytohabitans]ALG08612.1 hypothetical protein AOZ06_18310 [Kibdelosporangium phytohabitans]MBE1470302.1 hypothetical protein [Kibdelosporangium phytohabitans]